MPRKTARYNRIPATPYTHGKKREIQIAYLLAKQSGLCAICKVELDNNMVIDHDHDTNEVRGLLCRPCNLGLGAFRDDVRSLRRAAMYVAAYKEGATLNSVGPPGELEMAP